MKHSYRIIISTTFLGFLSFIISCKKASSGTSGPSVPSGTGASSFTKFQIIADDNLDSLYNGFGPNTHNGQVNVAEEIQFKVFLKNTGTGPSHNVKAKIIAPIGLYLNEIYNFRTTQSATGSTEAATNITFGDIGSGSEKACIETLYFDVERSGTAHDYDRLNFELDITADGGNSIIDTFSIEIMHFIPQYNFQMSSFTITQPSSGIVHNRNGFGFTGNFQIKNTGNSSAANITASLSKPKFFETMTIIGSSLNFGNINPKSSSAPVQVLYTLYGQDVNKPIPLGKVQDTLYVQDEFYNTWPLPYSYTIVP